MEMILVIQMGYMRILSILMIRKKRRKDKKSVENKYTA